MGKLSNFYDERYRSDYMGDFVRGSYAFRRGERIRQLIAKLYLSPKIKILDYGCGQGRYIGVLEEAFPGAEINGCDISTVAIEKAKNRYPKHSFLQFCDITPYESDTFDFILSIEVFEHVEDIFKTLNDISRILKVGGHLVFSTPCANPFSFEHIKCSLKKNGIQPSKDGFQRFYFEDAGHIRRLKSGEISAILRVNGIEEVFSLYDNHFFGGLQWMYGDRLRLALKCLKNRTGTKRLITIGLVPVQPIVFILDFLGWLEWVLFRKLANGSVMFGVFQKCRDRGDSID
ncbi:class I SAM-dependent methyltransferase [Chloroflexota bacterium]